MALGQHLQQLSKRHCKTTSIDSGVVLNDVTVDMYLFEVDPGPCWVLHCITMERIT
jgi:hypothetical protein